MENPSHAKKTEEVPQNPSVDKKLDKKPSPPILLIAGAGVVILLGIITAVIVMSNKSPVQNDLNNTTSVPTAIPTIPLQTEYDNPFDQTEDYTNPFSESEEYTNPFDTLE